MMIAAIILAVLPAAVTRWQRGDVVTPDGAFYLAMGRGDFVPRPYSLRSVAKYISNWPVVSLASLAMTAVGLYLWAAALYGSTAGMITAALWGALPATRRLGSWTTLVDATSQLTIIASGLLALWSPWAAAMAVVASQIAHERSFLYGPLMIWVTSHNAPAAVMALVAGFILLQLRRESKPTHPDEVRVPWLADPRAYCLAEHRKVAHDWRIWVLPWGAVWAWLMQPTTEAVLAFIIAMASLTVSVDRVRTMQAAPFVLCAAAAVALPYEFAFIGYLITCFIPDSHV